MIQNQRGYYAYKARTARPKSGNTKAAHLIADKIILAAMQEGVLLDNLVAQYREVFTDATSDGIKGALKKIADHHRRQVPDES
jgi:hypothetical protein